MSIPAGATFRRAEGLLFTVALCTGTDSIRVVCRRHGGETVGSLNRSAIRLLSRSSRWQTAEELGVSVGMLHELVRNDCMFWSPARPEQGLSGAPLDELAGRIALRRNVFARPMLGQPGRLVTFPHMPRLRELDHLQLAALRFDVIEWDTEVAMIAFSCCPRHAGIVRDLIPRLDGKQTFEDLADDRERRAVLIALDDLGLLERFEPAPWDGTPSVTWLGHAGVLFQSAGRRVLVDPALFPLGEPTRHVPAPFDPRLFGEVDAVLITHGDSDHFSPQALIRLPRSTLIVIPRPRSPAPYHVDMRRVLAILGFTNVMEVDAWDRVDLAPVTVVAAPFRGEDWGLDLPCLTYVVASPELTIYLNADSVTDPPTCERIAADFEIDLALVGVTGAGESHAMPPGYGYGHFYTRWIPEARHNEWVQLCNGPRAAADVAIRIGARFAFGYAAGGGSFYPLAYSDRGSDQEMAHGLVERGALTRPLTLALGQPTLVPR